jgi:hypothetical protein
MPAPWPHPSRIPFMKTGCRHSFRVSCPDAGAASQCECRAAFVGTGHRADASVRGGRQTTSMSRGHLWKSLAVPSSGQPVRLTSDAASR